MKAKGLVFIFAAVLLLFSGTSVYANGVPPLPHAFYGSVTIDGEPAPVGAVISAAGDGVETNTLQNPITTTVEGSYGIDSKMLLVQAEEGAVITFYVNGISTGQTIQWQSDTTNRVDLSVTTGASPGDGETPPSGGGTPPTDGGELASTLFGTEETFAISNDGEVLEAIAATSADDTLTITIPEGTIAKDKNDNPLSSVGVAVDNSPPSPPEDANIIGLAYNFGPDGAVFSPPITLEYSYDPDALPEGVNEEDLVIAYYDEDAGEWVGLTCTVDTENNLITASVSHFTTLAVIGTIAPPIPAAISVSNLSIHPTEVQPKEAVNITVSVTNTGGTEGSYTVALKVNGIKEAEKIVTIAAGESQNVTFSAAKEDVGNYSVVVGGLSGSFTVLAPPPPPPTPAPAAFSVSGLSIKPLEVQPKEVAAITVSVTNTGGMGGSYTVVLKINGLKETGKSVTIAAGGSETVSFSVTKEEADSYSVEVNGLSSSFTVVAPASVLPPAPVKTAINWPVLGGVITAVIIVGLLVFFLVRRRAC